MVDLAQLFRVMCSGVGAGRSNDRLTEFFPLAVNLALSELSVNTDSVSWPTVQGVSGMLDFPERYKYILIAGVDYHLLRMGAGTNSDPKLATVQYKDTEDRWTIGKGDYSMDTDNQKQHDPRNPMIAWGSLYDRDREEKLV